ncbi:hypothetical protein T265_05264 [Opisthorchis viverrini]|uniref:Phosphatidic acid phosphatase type 2/haloperoxidase domain-containing protein n=1 Tax=Opisthorchis viverrini TaxID=6198 RepID=A0A074ZL39_OPIVI|nr:hypothetical protein T265_05264 [Opisthorchis viverrini]KER27776.1 hypothetical protein T265_05264 [Opisthorchis viverrini]
MHKAVTVTIRILSDVLAFVVSMGVLQRIQPISQGYFADDYSIRLPRHSSTVSSVTLYSVSSVLILTTVVAVEVMIGWDSLRMKKAGIPVVLYSIYDYLLVAFYGYFVTITITDVGKAAVGRLRPSFFDQCGPNVLQSTVLGYITDYSCTSGSEKDHLDARIPTNRTSLVNIRMLDAAEAAARRLRNPVPCVQNLEVNRHEFVDLKTAHPVSQMSSQH